MEQPKLSLHQYTDKSVVVHGPGTKLYRAQLKEMGGRYNAGLKVNETTGYPGGPGWIYPKTAMADLEQFVKQANQSGISQFQSGNPGDLSVPSDTPAMPTFVMAVTSTKKVSQYQTVKWKVYKPEVGFNVDIKVVGSSNVTGKVVKVETHKDIVDTVYVQLTTGNATKLGIVNGRWQVISFSADHKVFFTSPDGSTDVEQNIEI